MYAVAQSNGRLFVREHEKDKEYGDKPLVVFHTIQEAYSFKAALVQRVKVQAIGVQQP